jgi:peptidoglycan/LPS O-acetylase OafA/YrhL
MKYRPEIDGLRALAVVPVILFHAGFELFSGGFVGVDVFFVISGYLITTILIEDIENDRFSLLNFYERRARRILPALFFVMFVCIPFAWMWMLPSQMKDFSQSLVAVSLFASNVLFWRESGYFDAAAEEKPLLHTWSLAVEEQYYVLFPIFLFLAWRYGKNRVFWMIVVMAAISLLLSEWGWRNKATANFYLAPTRAWELFAGSIAAFIVQKRGVQKNDPLSLLGLAAIVFSIFAYDESTPFPSVYALVPVLGVVLLVLYADKNTLAAKLLNTKAFVWIGLISYSSYLWHQPLFAFARIKSEGLPSEYLMIFLSVASVSLAYVSWRFIETPFRKGKYVSKRTIFTSSILGISFFVGIGFLGHKEDGFAYSSSDGSSININSLNHSAMPIFVVGDSHGNHLIEGINALNSEATVNMTSPGCIPFRDVDRYDSRSEIGACARAINTHLSDLQRVEKQSVVILSSMGPVYLDGTPFNDKDYARVTGLGVVLVTDKSIKDHYEVFETGMRNTLSELASNSNLIVVFALDVPELGIDYGCQSKNKQISALSFTLTDFVDDTAIKSCLVSRVEYDERTAEYKELVYRVLKDYPKVFAFDPTPYFCNSEICSGYSTEFGYLYRDVDHLSRPGSIYFADKLFGSFSFFE